MSLNITEMLADLLETEAKIIAMNRSKEGKNFDRPLSTNDKENVVESIPLEASRESIKSVKFLEVSKSDIIEYDQEGAPVIEYNSTVPTKIVHKSSILKTSSSSVIPDTLPMEPDDFNEDELPGGTSSDEYNSGAGSVDSLDFQSDGDDASDDDIKLEFNTDDVELKTPSASADINSFDGILDELNQMIKYHSNLNSVVQTK
jgi:hypothetical protein